MFLTMLMQYFTRPSFFSPIIPSPSLLLSSLSNNNICSSASKSSRVCDTVQCSLWVRQTETGSCYRETQKHQAASTHKSGKDLRESQTCWRRHTNKSMRISLHLDFLDYCLLVLLPAFSSLFLFHFSAVVCYFFLSKDQNDTVNNRKHSLYLRQHITHYYKNQIQSTQVEVMQSIAWSEIISTYSNPTCRSWS